VADSIILFDPNTIDMNVILFRWNYIDWVKIYRHAILVEKRGKEAF
jgi:hypothetical protein